MSEEPRSNPQRDVPLASILLVTLGAFSLLAGAFMFMGDGAWASPFAYLGVGLLAFGVAQVLVGMQPLAARRRARLIGMGLAGLGLGLTLASLLGSVQVGAAHYSLVGAALYGLLAFILVSAGASRAPPGS